MVGEAETGRQAIEEYERLKPDMVLMDIVMPDMGGLDAIREIRARDANACIVNVQRDGAAETHGGGLGSRGERVHREAVHVVAGA